jgi:AcrR family transcriptional regulator
MLSSEEKYEKKKNIAKSTCTLFVKKGYVNITISEIAKVAGVGKGTIYQYFKSKEEIVFELMGCLQDDYDEKLDKKLKSDISAKQKVISLFDIYFSDDDVVQIQRQIYKEYLAVLISKKSIEMQEFDKKMMSKYNKILETIFHEAIKKNELIALANNFIPSIFATLEGFFISSQDKVVMLKYIDDLFILLQSNPKEMV